MKGWLQRLHAWLFEGDIFASVASNDVLLRIHCTAEKFEDAAEECFVRMQVSKVQLRFLCHLTPGTTRYTVGWQYLEKHFLPVFTVWPLRLYQLDLACLQSGSICCLFAAFCCVLLRCCLQYLRFACYTCQLAFLAVLASWDLFLQQSTYCCCNSLLSSQSFFTDCKVPLSAHNKQQAMLL